MLDKAAQDVVGKSTPKYLTSAEVAAVGRFFVFRGYVDIFDAGPTVEAEVSQLAHNFATAVL